MKKVVLIGIILFCCLHSYSKSFNLPKKYTDNTHRGFYLSMALGYNSTSIDADSKNYGNSNFKGAGGVIDLKIGGTLTENVILHATILSHGVTGPKIEKENNYNNNFKADNKLLISEGMIGVGLTYYTPDNIFLSTSLGIGSFGFENKREDIDFTTDKGFGFQFKAGKEWWLSRKWGIGVAAYFHTTDCINQEGSYAEENISSRNFGIVFNATLNGQK